MCNTSSNCCRFECWGINECQCVNYLTNHHWYGLLKLQAYSCSVVDCMTQSFAPCLDPSTPPLNCWLLETHCLVWPTLFLTVLDRWICTGMETPHESMKPTCQQGTVQAGGTSVMVCSMCSWHNMRPPICLKMALTDDTYISILFDHLHPFMSIVHSSRIVWYSTHWKFLPSTKWLKEHSSEFRNFHWPPKSPDMNIIEHIWDALQHAAQKISPSPRTLAGFMV